MGKRLTTKTGNSIGSLFQFHVPMKERLLLEKVLLSIMMKRLKKKPEKKVQILNVSFQKRKDLEKEKQR